ncbi:MAG: NAD+ synthase [Deltaproteobacteria bacterium]|nr:NAD+ synthase [Deltaproteobacteria bacterium]
MIITLAQLNPFIGDIEGNLEKVIAALQQGSRDGSDLVVCPELCLTGYPPRDLLERPRFIVRVNKALEKLLQASRQIPETGIIVGAPVPTGNNAGRGLYNAAVFICGGKTLFVQHKTLLPTYDVFDEARYFDTAEEIGTVRFKGETLGISVCEDAWNDPGVMPKQQYPQDPIEDLVARGATLIINISASPFYVGKDEMRYRILQNVARKYHIASVFVNQAGGNDELIFDGRSMGVDAEGNAVAVLPAFQEQVQTVDMGRPGAPERFQRRQPAEDIHDALVLGLRDYVGKSGFSQVVLGLSGGIDSAVVCALAVAALGPDNVVGVTMPSRYSSTGSVDDSLVLADNLGIACKTVPIKDIYDAFEGSLAQYFAGRAPDVTEENLQARIRGNLLMCMSNKFGSLLLATGNKSEVAVGYCTIYGDMCGGLAVISDVPKTMVYELAHYINREREIIPRATIDKAPSAELRPDQKDQDSLPPYDVLDRILHAYVDEGCCRQKIIDQGFDAEIVTWVIRTVDRNEYKRRQAAPGLKVTSKAFGMGRRMMIAAKYDE